MGEVICVYKIMPDSPENFDSVKAALEKLNPERLEEESIAFGLKSLKFTAIIPDGSGKLEELEGKLESIPNITRVENIMTTRAL